MSEITWLASDGGWPCSPPMAKTSPRINHISSHQWILTVIATEKVVIFICGQYINRGLVYQRNVVDTACESCDEIECFLDGYVVHSEANNVLGWRLGKNSIHYINGFAVWSPYEVRRVWCNVQLFPPFCGWCDLTRYDLFEVVENGWTVFFQHKFVCSVVNGY